MNRRNGFTMIEIMVALVLLGVPILVLVGWTQSNRRNVKFLEQRLSARLVLIDLAGLLSGEPEDRLARIGESPESELDSLLEGRVAGLPEELRERYRAQIQDLRGRLGLRLEKDHGGVIGLCRLELVASLSRNATSHHVWYLRPGARVGARP